MINFLTEVVTETNGILNTAMELIKSYWPQLLALISTPIVTTAIIKCIWKIISEFIKAKYQTKANIALTKKLDKTEEELAQTKKQLTSLENHLTSLLANESIKNEAFRNAILSSNGNYEVKATYEKELSNVNFNDSISGTDETNANQKEEIIETNLEPVQENAETKEVQYYEKVETNVGISLD